ncbi:carbohydrate-binding protein [Pseudoalteromonas sp. NBT06-2]|uniref:carbohydrate-binding protein n=1 Tax=Pseudoalteromonas sp. NBT06-2 TaxID=2025950 RepID=UPI002074B2C6|nr:carbohydrate-binding protein [Pseudoalteromonas sp. NBT06-2]
MRLTQIDGLVNLTWDASSDPDVDGYRIYRNDIAGTMVKLIASNLKETSFKYAHTSGYVYEYTVVAVKNHQQGMYSDTVKTEASWLKVPGRIEAESAAQDDGAVVSRTSDDEGSYNLTGAGGISDKAKLDYQLDVAQSGEYLLTYRVASPRDTKGFSVIVNGDKQVEQKITKTGGYHEWQTQQGGKIYLKKGKNKLSLNSLDNNWKLNWLALKQD